MRIALLGLLGCLCGGGALADGPGARISVPLQVHSATGSGPLVGATLRLRCPSPRRDTTVKVKTGSDGIAVLTAVQGANCEVLVGAKGHGSMQLQWTVSKVTMPILLWPLPPGSPEPNEDGSIESYRFVGDIASPDAGGDAVAAEPVSADAPAVNDPRAMLRTVLLQLAIVLAPLLAYLGLRELTVRLVVWLMMRRAGATPAAAVGEAADAPAAAAPAPALAFLEVSTLNGVILNGAAQQRLERMQETARRKLGVVLQSFAAQVGVLAVVMAALVWAKSEGLTSAGFAAGALLLADLVLLIYLWGTWLQQLRVVELFAVLGVLASGAFMLAGLPVYLSGLPVLAQAATAWVGLRRLRAVAQQAGNQRIAMLRVFGSDRNAAFTFGPVMAMWRFLGSFITVADPSYVRWQFSLFNRANALKSLGATVTIGASLALLDQLPAWLPAGRLPAWLQALSEEDRQQVLRALIYTGVCLLAVAPALLYIWRRFLRSPEAARARVRAIAGRGLGVESDFGGSAVFCFDDVWRSAVAELLAVADVVLMDLRGFTPERQGCRYEIGELIDHVPMDRVLVLIDGDTPKDALFALVRERWQAMAAASPNRRPGPVTIRVYEAADRDHRDVVRIAALLSLALEGPVAVAEGGLATVA